MSAHTIKSCTPCALIQSVCFGTLVPPDYNVLIVKYHPKEATFHYSCFDLILSYVL